MNYPMPTNNNAGTASRPAPSPNVIRDIQRASNDSICKRTLFIDFETFYGTKYSLRSKEMTYNSYIRDSRFEVMCASLIVDDQQHTFTGVAFDNWIKTMTPTWWAETRIVAHNMMFDGLILAERYGIRPAQWVCTLSLVRALFQGSIGNGLDNAATMLGFKEKSGVLLKTHNKHWHDLTGDEQLALLEYCAEDTKKCEAIYNAFWSLLPETEQELLHITLQQFLEPKLYIDEARLEREISRVETERATLVAASGTTLDVLRSVPKFAEELKRRGIEPPTKWSNKQEKEVNAFSRTDLPWARLVNEWKQTARTDLVALAAARMNCASSIHVTRPQRLLELSRPNRPIGAAYNYYGAHTGRWSGANKMNFQNFKRKGEIRKCILAPDGYVIVVGDASQIELRFNAWLHGEQSTLDTLRSGKCVYRRMAGAIYGLTNEEADALDSGSPERFVAKVAELGLGYSMSGPKFNDTLALGAMGPAVFMSQEQTNHIVYNVYRPSHPHIVNGWAILNEALYRMMHKDCRFTYNCLEFRHNRVILPNGMAQVYEGLRATDERTIEYFADGMWKKIYGGLFDENLVQALARIPMGDAMRTIRREFPVVLHTHDELGLLVREQDADTALKALLDTIATPPSWALDIPLAAEGGYDVCYSK